MNKEIIYAFIDGQNLYESLNRKGIEISYEKYRKYLRNRYGVNKAILFLGSIHKDIYRKAKRAGFLIKKKLAVPQIDEKGRIVMKANVDIDLVVEAIGNSWGKYDKAVIVSGDGDFLPLIEYLKKKDKLKIVIIPNREHSSRCYEREDMVDCRVYMNDPEEKVELLLQ